MSPADPPACFVPSGVQECEVMIWWRSSFFSFLIFVQKLSIFRSVARFLVLISGENCTTFCQLEDFLSRLDDRIFLASRRLELRSQFSFSERHQLSASFLHRPAKQCPQRIHFHVLYQATFRNVKLWYGDVHHFFLIPHLCIKSTNSPFFGGNCQYFGLWTDS